MQFLGGTDRYEDESGWGWIKDVALGVSACLRRYFHRNNVHAHYQDCRQRVNEYLQTVVLSAKKKPAEKVTGKRIIGEEDVGHKRRNHFFSCFKSELQWDDLIHADKPIPD